MKRTSLVLAFGFLLLILGSAWPRAVGFGSRPDFSLIITVYLGIVAAGSLGGLGVFILGYMKDVFSGYYLGLNSFLLLIAFSLTIITSQFFSFRSHFVRTIAVFFLFILQNLLFLSLLKLFGAEVEFSLHLFWRFLGDVVLTLACAPLLMWLLDKANEKLFEENPAKI